MLVTEREIHDDFFQSQESVDRPPRPRFPWRKVGDEFRFWWSVVLPHYYYVLIRRRIRKPNKRWFHRHIPGGVVLWYLLSWPLDRSASKKQPWYPNKELVRGSWVNDIFGGLSVGAMSVPQGMSYAQLANLPINMGLYNNMIFPMLYCFFGTSRQAVAGTAAVENIMIGTTITSVLDGGDYDSQTRANAGVALAFLMGITYLLFRLVRLAALADLLADPLLSGFSSASALVVGSSQLKHFLNVSGIGNEWNVPHIWYFCLRHLPQWKIASLLTGCISLAFLKLVKESNKRWIRAKIAAPGPLLLVVIATLVSYCADLQGKYGIKVVGYIQQGLPTPFWPSFHFNGSPSSPQSINFWFMELQAIKIAAIFFIIHIAITRCIAIRNGYELDNQQELTAFGATNALGALIFRCYPACTSMSRTSVADSLGVKTNLHGFAAGLIVMAVLLFLTKALYYLPNACLAAVVMFGIKKMFEPQEFLRLYRLQRASWASRKSPGGGTSSPDFLLWVVSFILTLCLAADLALIITFSLSIVCLGRQIFRPEFVELGRLPGTSCYRNIQRFPSATTFTPRIRVVRFDAPINFANAKNLEKRMLRMVARMTPVPVHSPSSATSTDDDDDDGGCRRDPQHRVLILDCSSVVNLDSTAILCLFRIYRHAKDRGVEIVFSHWKGPQRDFLACADFYRVVPPERCFLSNEDAVQWALQGHCV